MKAQRKNGAGKGETICGFLHSYVFGLLRESYLEFVAAQYDCDQCRWMAESKRNGQLPKDRKYWEH